LNQTFDGAKVTTSDLSLDLLANGWSLYQAIVFRLWERTGFYQSGGAFEYCNQLHDVLSSFIHAPNLSENDFFSLPVINFTKAMFNNGGILL
jgi:cyclic beta-1,2-glucan synthetase